MKNAEKRAIQCPKRPRTSSYKFPKSGVIVFEALLFRPSDLVYLPERALQN